MKDATLPAATLPPRLPRKQRKIPFTVTLDGELMDRLEAQCDRRGRPRATMVSDILALYIPLLEAEEANEKS